MIKTIIIASYIAHKIWWKKVNKETVISWKDFFKDVI